MDVFFPFFPWLCFPVPLRIPPTHQADVGFLPFVLFSPARKYGPRYFFFFVCPLPRSEALGVFLGFLLSPLNGPDYKTQVTPVHFPLSLRTGPRHRRGTFASRSYDQELAPSFLFDLFLRNRQTRGIVVSQFFFFSTDRAHYPPFLLDLEPAPRQLRFFLLIRADPLRLG